MLQTKLIVELWDRIDIAKKKKQEVRKGKGHLPRDGYFKSQAFVLPSFLFIIGRTTGAMN